MNTLLETPKNSIVNIDNQLAPKGCSRCPYPQGRRNALRNWYFKNKGMSHCLIDFS
jgi:hypothetical protein